MATLIDSSNTEMTHSQATQVLNNNRYSIPRLRELSFPSGRPFDLSKFSFDAVRAGVVPALSQCSASIREPNGDRPRWSSETNGSMDEYPVYPTNASQQHPIRQPNVPPTDTRAQTDLGFARFLKKHASPTHQRVTAGGRIVPMEKRPAPPEFALKNENNAQKPEAQRFGESDKSLTPNSLAYNFHVGDPTRVSPVTSQLSPANGAAFQVNTNIAPGPGPGFLAGGMIDMGHPVGHLPFSPVLHPAQYLPSFAQDPIGIQSGSIFYQGLAPIAAPTPLYPNPYSIAPYSNGFWPFPDQYAMSGLQTPLDVTLDLEQQLAQANVEFEELDRQLKELDRHRAMNNYDPSRAAQRVEIVDQRAKAKENATRLRTALKHGTTTATTNSSSSSSHRLNVEAAAWIPKCESKGNKSVPIQKPAESQSKVTPIEEPNSRRSTTVPSAQYDPFVATVPPVSPELEGVDEWGARLGRAPPELERQQSKMLESMASERSSNSSPTSSIGTAGENITAQLHQSLHSGFQDRSKSVSVNGESDSSSGIAEWVSTKPGRAPPNVEQDYALHLDAMRKPEGITTHVRTSKGQVFVVEGQALKRPASRAMTDFELKYWSRTPEVEGGFTKAGRQNQENSMASGDKVCGWTSETDVAGDRVDGRISTSRKGHQKILADIFKGGTNEMQRASSQSGFKERSTESLSAVPPLTPSDILKGVGGDFAQNPVREAEVDFSNKGYSSVAVQNIHAISRLPHGLDGAIDKIQRVASKARSPRILHRATPTGKAWYGPFRREILEQIETQKGEKLAKQGVKGAYV